MGGSPRAHKARRADSIGVLLVLLVLSASAAFLGIRHPSFLQALWGVKVPYVACETPRIGSSSDISSPPPVVSYLPKEPHPQATPEEIAKLFNRIKDDLAPWAETGITQDMVERSYCTTFDRSFRLQIVNGDIYIVGEVPGWTEFQRYVKLLILDVHRRYPLPDLDVVLTTNDGCPQLPSDYNTSNCAAYAPIFAYDKRRDEKHCVAYPDHTFMGWPTVNLPSWDEVTAMMQQHAYLPWIDRFPQLFFFGSTTGPRNLLRDDERLHRNVNMDIQISGWSENRTPDQFISIPQHCNYRYLLQMPGWAYSARLKYLLLCKSTVLFSFNDYEEFWYQLLEDGVNIVMMDKINPRDRGGPLIAKMRELKLDAERSQRIAEAGYDLVHRVLTSDNVYRYFAELLQQYAALQRFRPQVHADAKPLVESAMRPDGDVGGKGIKGRTCARCELLEAPYMREVFERMNHFT